MAISSIGPKIYIQIQIDEGALWAEGPQCVALRLRRPVEAARRAVQALKVSCAFAQDERLRRMLLFKKTIRSLAAARDPILF